MADLPKVRSLADVRAWVAQLGATGVVRSTGVWPASMVLEHLAQSVEMSLDGFPAPRAAWFRHTVGPAAFQYFRLRGAMSHGLAEPIPGAPALGGGTDWRPAAVRLGRAIDRFEAHSGQLAPHFAYGALDKGEFALAHAFHVANHQDEFVVG